MNNIQATRKLRIIIGIGLIVLAVIAILGENGFFADDRFSVSPELEYILSTVGIFLTIISIPLALKLLTFERVQKYIATGKPAYLQWACIRIVILCVPMHFHLIMYYLLTYSTTSAFQMLMMIMAILFIWPSDGRMEREIEMAQSKGEE